MGLSEQIPWCRSPRMDQTIAVFGAFFIVVRYFVRLLKQHVNWCATGQRKHLVHYSWKAILGLLLLWAMAACAPNPMLVVLGAIQSRSSFDQALLLMRGSMAGLTS